MQKMKHTFVLFSLFYWFATGTVVKLNDANFESIVFGNPSTSSSASASDDWFISFYSPSCGHCQLLEPIWEEVGVVLQNDGGSEGRRVVRVGAVDVTQNRNLADRFMIKSLPTLRLFSSEGRMYTYQGDRNLDDILAYAKATERVLYGSTEIPGALLFHEKFAALVTTKLFWIQSRAKEAIAAWEEGRYDAPSLLGFVLPAVFVFVLVSLKLVFGTRRISHRKRAKQH